MLHRDLRPRPDRDRGDGLRLPRLVRGAARPRDLTRGLLAGGILLALAACATPRKETAPAPAPAARAWAGGTELTSNDGGWRIVYRLERDPIPRGETFSLDAWVFAPGSPDAPRGDVELSVDAAMPEHGHGMNRVPRIEAGDGHFRAEGLLFHMPGKWELYFDVTQGAVTERAQTIILLE